MEEEPAGHLVHGQSHGRLGFGLELDRNPLLGKGELYRG